MRPSRDRAIGPIGTASRAVIGTAMIVAAIADRIGWWDVAAGLTALPAIALTAAVLTRAARSAVGTAAVIVAVVGPGTLLTFVSPVDGPAIFLYVGLSMLLAALRGDAGCELVSLPDLVLGRRTEVWCPVFTPIDRVEARADPDSARAS
jgi:hypothetical protein